MKPYIVLAYGLFILWTGLLRSIEAQAFKPNAFWFCVVIAAISFVGVYLIRWGWDVIGSLVVSGAAITALAFYLRCLMVQPEKDATVRVSLAIIASVGVLVLLWLPSEPSRRMSK